eukprot:1874140-Rhodomonas_salina.1
MTSENAEDWSKIFFDLCDVQTRSQNPKSEADKPFCICGPHLARSLSAPVPGYSREHEGRNAL